MDVGQSHTLQQRDSKVDSPQNVSRLTPGEMNPRVRQGQQELDPTGIRANWLSSVLGFNMSSGP